MIAENIRIEIRLQDDMGKNEDIFTGSLKALIEQAIIYDSERRGSGELVATNYKAYITENKKTETLFY